MHRIKKVLFGLIILGSCATAQAEETLVRIATEGAFPPYSFVNPDGSLGGFDVDIANALCAEMKAKCELVKQDWDGMIPGLLAKKYDAIVSSMNITPERQQKVAFSDKYEGGYSVSNRPLIRRRARSASVRMTRRGCSAGMKSSSLAIANRDFWVMSAPRMAIGGSLQAGTGIASRVPESKTWRERISTSC